MQPAYPPFWPTHKVAILIFCLMLGLLGLPQVVNSQGSGTIPPSFTKSAVESGVSPGGTITFKVGYNNPNNFNWTGVSIKEHLPANTTFVEPQPGWTCDNSGGEGTICTASVTTLPANRSGTLDFIVRVKNPAPAGFEQVENKVTISGNNLTTTSLSHTVPVNAAPDLAVTINDNTTTTTPGSTLTYAISYSNTGNQAASGVKLSVVIPSGTNILVGSSPGWSCTPAGGGPGSTCTDGIGTVAAGASGSSTLALTVRNPFPANNTAINTTVTIADDGTSGEINLANNSATDTTNVVAAPDLVISKSASADPVRPGEILTYTLTYKNIGSQVATGVVINEQLPANTTFEAARSSTGWTKLSGNNYQLTVPPLGATPRTALFVVRVADTIPANVKSLQNQVQISDDGNNGADLNPANNQATLTTAIEAQPDLVLLKSDDVDEFGAEPGDTIVYTLHYANNGDQAATGVVLSETVPANTTFNLAASDSGWSCADGAGPGTTCTLAVGTVNAGTDGSTIFAVKLNEAIAASVVQIVNTASIADDGAHGLDKNPANNSASKTTQIAEVGLLDLTKTDNGISAPPGTVINYVLNYTNHNTIAATGVVINETVPANTTFAGNSAIWGCAANAPAGTVCKYTVGTLAPGAKGAVSFPVRVNQTLPDDAVEIVNIATIGSSSEPNADVGRERTPIGGMPQLILTKSDLGVTATPGSELSYQLSYGNVGDRSVLSVRITETVPAHTVMNPALSDSNWVCPGNGQPNTICTFSIDRLSPSVNPTTINFVVTVSDTVPAGANTVDNTAQIGYPSKPNAATSSTVTPLNAAPDLQLSKSDGDAIVRPEDVVIYTLRYRNVGNQGASNVVLTEQIPVHTTFSEIASTPGWRCVEQTCTLQLGTVPAGASGEVEFALIINKTIPSGVKQIDNTAKISDDGRNGADPTPANNTASDSTPVVTVLALLATKEYAIDNDLNADGEVNPDDSIIYTVRITNQSLLPAANVVFSDTIDVNSQLTGNNVVITSQGTILSGNQASDRLVQVSLGTLNPGQTATIRFPVKIVNPLPAGVNALRNQGKVTSTGNPTIVTDDPEVPGSNNVTITPIVPNMLLRVTKIGLFASDDNDNGLVDPGERLQYRIRVINNGNTALNNIVLTDTPDPNTTLVNGSVRVNRGTIRQGNNTGDESITIEIGELLPGAGQSIEISMDVLVNGGVGVNVVANQAVASYSGVGGTPTTVLSDNPRSPAPNDPFIVAIQAIPEPDGTRIHLPVVAQ
jgi:uncharacterized repeat protein (TIGR01451 family)